MDKMLIYIGVTIGGIIGVYIPSLLFHADALSLLGLIGGIIGSFIGLYVGYRVQQNMD